MRAGEMRHRITIVDPTAAQDPETGQPTDNLEAAPVVLTCWAGIRSASSKEIYKLGAGFDGQVTHAIRIRYPKNLPKSGMRVIFGDRSFRLQVLSDPEERRRELDLMCLELTK